MLIILSSKAAITPPSFLLFMFEIRLFSISKFVKSDNKAIPPEDPKIIFSITQLLMKI